VHILLMTIMPSASSVLDMIPVETAAIEIAAAEAMRFERIL